LIGFPGGKVTF